MRRIGLAVAIVVLTAGIGSCDTYAFSPCGTEGGPPAVCIVSPLPGETRHEFVGADLTFDIEVVVANFTLRDPGHCGSSSSTCGHLHLFIDKDTVPCSPNGTYQLFTADTILHASLALCRADRRFMSHIIRVELHNDIHGDISPPTGVQQIFIAAAM